MRRIRDANVLRRVRLKIGEIESAAALSEVRGIRRVSARGHYRIRVGNHRIGVSVDGNKVSLIRIMGRNDIYRFFP